MANSGLRIPFITREEWTEETLDVWTVMARNDEEREEGRKNGSKMNLLNVLAHHPGMAVPYLEFGKALFQIRIPLRLREIAVLRLSHLSNSEYEWFQHVSIGKFAGLTDDEIEAIRIGEPPAAWGELECLMMEAVDELEGENTLSDAMWDKLSQHLDRQQVMEFLFMISYYKMTAWILNAVGVPLDDMPQGRPPV